MAGPDHHRIQNPPMPPVEQWPSLDRKAWMRAISSNRPFDQLTRASQWTGLTRQTNEQCYARWLLWLAQAGELDPLMRPAERITRERVGRYLAELRSRNSPITVAGRIRGLSEMISLISPRTDLFWLSELKTQLVRTAEPSRRKRDRLQSSSDLFQFGIRLMRRAHRRPWNRGHPPYIQYRTGLMIAFLAARPLRMRNFATMCIGQHLICQGGLYHAVFEKHETKTGWPIDLPLPAQLTPYIRRYLACYRPLLLNSPRIVKQAATKNVAANRALWISENGTALSSSAMAQQIGFATKRKFGIKINPHLFRDCAVTSFAIEDPDHIPAVAALLGVRTLRVIERNYNHASPESAIRRYFDTIMAIRENG